MGIRVYKPRTPGRRGMTAVTTEELSKKRPEKSLTSFRRSTGARNNDGRTTVRFRGGGHKRLYRKIDFRRDKTGIPGTIAALEYDPNRSARIALVHYKDGEKRYILAPVGLASRRCGAVRCWFRGSYWECVALVQYAVGNHHS